MVTTAVFNGGIAFAHVRIRTYSGRNSIFDIVAEHPILTTITVVIWLIYELIQVKNKVKMKEVIYNNLSNNEHNFISEDTVVNQIKARDEFFNIGLFKSKVVNMYVTLQDAWGHKNLKGVRPFETDQLLGIQTDNLREFINKNRTYVMDNICIENITLVNYHEDTSSDIAHLKVKIAVKQKDYIVDDTNTVIKGNPHIIGHSIYVWTLIRKINTKSNMSKSKDNVTCCSSCGTSMSIGMSGICNYCGSVVSTGDYDWVLSEIEKIYQS